MAAARSQFHIHTLVGHAAVRIWPFTRLVHAFTAPLHYLFRPYIVYRSRDARPAPGTSAPPARLGPVGTRDRDRLSDTTRDEDGTAVAASRAIALRQPRQTRNLALATSPSRSPSGPGT